MDDFQLYLDIAKDHIISFLPRVIGAILILWIGFKLAKKALKILDNLLTKVAISATLQPFFLSLANVLIKGTLIFIAATLIGADLTGLVAILAAAGFAIGMALQGSLGNFASGILILTLKPYSIGDWIQIDDKFGKVEEIGIFNTKVITPGNKLLIIPNASITDQVLTNYSEKGMIRLELGVTIPYAESYPKIRDIIFDALIAIPNIEQEPAPEIGIHIFDTHNIQLMVRPFVKPDNYWAATFSCNQAIKNAFSQNGIKVAYSEGIEMGKIGE